MNKFSLLIAEVRGCVVCRDQLKDGVRPVLQVHSNARILIAGQAPGRKVHESGVPFDDASGDRLREWMGISNEIFYDSSKVAILPMGFCYPGKGRSGDLPPRKECAPTWREKVLREIPNIELTLVLGKYAQDYHFGKSKQTLTELVRSWRDHLPTRIPLPHPSPRNNIWLKKNPWFTKELLPKLKNKVKDILEIQ